jgi:Lactate dehydrogenase and related dehydrogenases
MKNIVVLDAHTLSPLQPGEQSPFHPSWDALAALGPLQLHPRTKPEEVVARAQDAQILLTNKAVVTAEHINALPQLEYIGVMATGYNVVDLEAARARGIPVTNVPGYGTASVAQHVFALLLELAAHVGATDAAVKNGDWSRCPDFSFTVSPFIELAGKTLGIVGYGTIGRAVARIATAFGMRVLATSRTPKPTGEGVEWATFDELLRLSDVVTLHCPLTGETRHLINRETLAQMKPTAFLINTGRGPLIDEEALASALKNHTIAGFAGDVLSAEPPPPSNPLLTAPRTVITPHIAWASVEARSRLMNLVAKNILDFLAGTPANVVNGVGASPEEPSAVVLPAVEATSDAIEISPEETTPQDQAARPFDARETAEPASETPASSESPDETAETPSFSTTPAETFPSEPSAGEQPAAHPEESASTEPEQSATSVSPTEEAPVPDSSAEPGTSHVEFPVELAPSAPSPVAPASPTGPLLSEQPTSAGTPEPGFSNPSAPGVETGLADEAPVPAGETQPEATNEAIAEGGPSPFTGDAEPAAPADFPANEPPVIAESSQPASSEAEDSLTRPADVPASDSRVETEEGSTVSAAPPSPENSGENTGSSENRPSSHVGSH